MEIHCENAVETKTLIGIFLIQRDSCKILFKQQELIFQEASYGKPLVMGTVNSGLKKHEDPKFKINLQKLERPAHPIVPIKIEPIIDHKPSIWTIILYILLIGTFVYALLKWKQRRNLQSQRKTKNQQLEEIMLQEEKKISLSGDASF